ncbi:unnamed protein product [Rhizoctonia solani]|uniref:ARID domain-containing protein n=1 Tax=Rhizoctonia solani TaxID=456999 RepID=A0A8H3E9M2_9AGAM|nr:unnamed protein product [Rhizoctonia solani]
MTLFGLTSAQVSPAIATMSEEMFGGPQSGMSSGGLNMNSDIAKQMSLLTAAGRLRATSAGGQQPQMAMRGGMAPPVPPNVPGDKQRAQFLGMVAQVLAQRGIALPPFVTGQPNPAYNPDSGPLKGVQPASDNRIGALRLPGAVPGRAGDVDIFKLWSAVTGAGGMQRIQANGQWDNVANHIGYQPSPGLSNQLAQLYFVLLSPLEEQMKRSAQAKQAQILAQQQQQQQQNLTPAQLHQQQQGMGVGGIQNPAMVNPALGGMQNPGLGGMQNPMQNNMGGPGLGAMQNPTLGATGLGVGGIQNSALGGMQNPAAALGGMQNPAAALSGMQNSAALGSIQNPTLGGVMQNNLAGGVMQNNLTGLGGMQMTPAQIHQQQNQQPALTPAQLHAMQNPTANGPNPALGIGVGVGAASGSTMPPPAPVPIELGGKRKSEPDDDEKRAKLKVADPVPATTSRRTKIEYVPLRLDVETWGGRALDGMMAGVGAQGSMERNVRDISELGTVDITSIILSLRSRTPRALGYALGSLSVLSSHIQQSFPLMRCEDLLDVLVELLESAALDGDGWMGGPLGSEREAIQSRIKQEENLVKREDGVDEIWDEQDEEIPIRTHRELVRIAAEMGVGMRAKGRGWDGGVVGANVKREDGETDPELDSIYGDTAPPGIARSDVIITIVRLLRNFSIGQDNCQFMTREGSRVVDVLASIVGFREDKDAQVDGPFSWDTGVNIHISPLSSSLNLPQLLRIRKDVLHIIANLGLHVRLGASTSTPQNLFQLMASFLLDPADTRSPVQLYQHLLPNRRFSLTTEIALDAFSRIAHADANRAVFQRTVSPVLLKAVFTALVKMLPAEPNDMILLIRSEMWMAYAERIALALYSLACSLPLSTRATIRTQHRHLGASVLRMMCRMAQYDPSPDKANTPWAQRSPFVCLVRRVIEALRVIDEPEEEVQGWPVRGGKLEGGKASGWLAGIGAEDALLMMSIEGMDGVMFEDLEVLTRVGELRGVSVGMSARSATRSAHGCLTCKQRRKKCDETRPICQRCKQGKFKCLGYTYLDSQETSNSRASKSKDIADTPLFSYEPIRLPSSNAQGSAPSAKASPVPITPLIPSPLGRSSELVERRRTQDIISAPRRPDAESIPRIIRLESDYVNKIVQLVLSQLSRLGFRVFMPDRIQADVAIARRAYRSDLLRWVMYLGAQITQMLLDGPRRKNYLGLIRRFHQQVVSDSPMSLNSDLTTRLGAALDLTHYAFMVSDSATGYSIFKNTTPLWYQFAAEFPPIRSHGSTVSLVYAISVPRYELSKFILWDIVCAFAFGISSILRYDTTYRSMDTKQSFLEWVYGCPLPFVVLLARITASRGTPDACNWQETEMHLKQWRPKSTYVDKDSRKAVARLAIQESWRQSMYIYLYMGMCGVDSTDSRVGASVRQIVRLSASIEGTSPLGLHLFIPCLIAGVAARAEHHRAALRTRIYASREAHSWILRGADFVPVLDHLWRGAARDGQPVKWEDYVCSRRATFTIVR